MRTLKKVIFKQLRSLIIGWLGSLEINLIHKAPNPKSGPILLAKARNEDRRIKNFLNYYENLGVGKIILIDNGSSDHTIEYAKESSICEIYQTNSKLSNCMRWFYAILNKECKNKWFLICDLDEIFKYPNQDTISLTDLCCSLDKGGFSALSVVLLDMYPEGPISKTEINSNDDPLKLAPFFDPLIRSESRSDKFSGGVRKRVFGLDSFLQKTPLIRHSLSNRYGFAFHYVIGPKISSNLGIILHFKFFAHELIRSKLEVIRESYWKKSYEYKVYAEMISKNPELTLSSSISKRFVSVEDLVKDGIISWE